VSDLVGIDLGGGDIEADIAAIGRIVPISMQNAGADVILTSRPGRLMAYHIVEPTATSGVDALFYDGTSANGRIIIPAYLTAGAHEAINFGPLGVPIESGIFCHMILGQLYAVLWFKV
jgi:hypothetical protein